MKHGQQHRYVRDELRRLPDGRSGGSLIRQVATGARRREDEEEAAPPLDNWDSGVAFHGNFSQAFSGSVMTSQRKQCQLVTAD